MAMAAARARQTVDEMDLASFMLLSFRVDWIRWNGVPFPYTIYNIYGHCGMGNPEEARFGEVFHGHLEDQFHIQRQLSRPRREHPHRPRRQLQSVLNDGKTHPTASIRIGLNCSDS